MGSENRLCDDVKHLHRPQRLTCRSASPNSVAPLKPSFCHRARFGLGLGAAEAGAGQDSSLEQLVWSILACR